MLFEGPECEVMHMVHCSHVANTMITFYTKIKIPFTQFLFYFPSTVCSISPHPICDVTDIHLELIT